MFGFTHGSKNYSQSQGDFHTVNGKKQGELVAELHGTFITNSIENPESQNDGIDWNWWESNDLFITDRSTAKHPPAPKFIAVLPINTSVWAKVVDRLITVLKLKNRN